MSRRILSAVALLIGNAVGLLLAVALLPGFKIAPLSIIVVVLVFTVVQVIADPLITRISEKNVPALKGGVALAVTFVGLLITDLIASGLTIGGVSNLLAATLLVWLGAVIAGVLIPMFLFKELQDNKAKK
ncbi:phage holin family protein [Tropicibacter sp. R16_0]|uniref:phage holin family protein n=1 Tax=Tropicibacter sp. R16_0 TaxID=2821102 RepID=UPI001ADB5C4E|nr:phage holin family protein [Tropicibacter sp. R16_0]MBO9450525.1 phage holin family protein [Tropicibacter sp. R16_0]